MRFSCFDEKLLVDGDIKEAPEPDELGDVRFDADDVDGVLNVPGENLLSVHDVTVCSKPLCSISERGVRCTEIPVGTATQYENWGIEICYFLYLIQYDESSKTYRIIAMHLLISVTFQ